jgi:hypothetical protein
MRQVFSKLPLGVGAKLLGLGIVAIALSGCVAYPSSQYGYGYGNYGYYNQPSYYAPPVYVPPPAFSGSIVLGGGWGGWGDDDDRGGWRGGWRR